MNSFSTISLVQCGKVTLVGAGPGDPDLLTIKAVKAIAAADVVLVDDLVHADILLHARADARIVPVGKRGGCVSTPQEFIERLMISEVERGHNVVRLKGGDPFMFGRGGEEMRHLAEAGITVEYIPGISSGMAAPASIGIPVTHRDHSQGVIFVTGHRRRARTAQPDDDEGCAPDVNWPALAATGLTLVIYMGVGRASAIRAALLAAGKPGTTPVAVVQSATLATQRHLLTTLERLDTDLATSGLRSPAIITVGDVVSLAQAQEFAASHPRSASSDAQTSTKRNFA